jgi:hypothetical protein
MAQFILVGKTKAVLGLIHSRGAGPFWWITRQRLCTYLASLTHSKFPRYIAYFEVKSTALAHWEGHTFSLHH